MGTNYYLRENECEHCGRYDDKHIGKSSAGWCFALHVYPDEGIHDLADWIPRIEAGHIRDEYGREVDSQAMLANIREREWGGPSERAMDPAFFRENHAKPGPNGLARHQVDGRHCVGNGEGTWDLLDGEFS